MVARMVFGLFVLVCKGDATVFAGTLNSNST